MHRSLLVSALLIAAVDTATLHSQLIARPDSAWRYVRSSIARDHPELVTREAALSAALARARARGNAPPAELSAGMEEGARSTRIDLMRELWSGGRRGAERAVAEANVTRSRVELEVAERRLGIRADQLLLASAGSFAVAERLAAADSLLAGAEEALRDRFAVGGARYADVLRLRAERLKVQSDRVARAGQADNTRLALLDLIAAPRLRDSLEPTVDDVIRRTMADTAVSTLPGLPALDTLISQSKSVRLAEAEVASSRAALALADAERHPGLHVGVGIQRFEVDGNARLGPTLTATLNLPFTSPGPRRGAIAAGLDVRRAETGRAAAAAEARVAANAAIARYRTARQRLLIYDTGLLRGARDEREAALASFRIGETSLLELLDFELALMRAEIAQVETRSEAIDALADLLSGDVHDSSSARDGEDR